MSDSLMPFQPAIDDPSNILPSLKKPSSTRRVGMETWCSLPSVSVKRRSANFASFSLINFRTSAGVMCVLAKVCGGRLVGRGSAAIAANVPHRCIDGSSTCSQRWGAVHHHGTNGGKLRHFLVHAIGTPRRWANWVHGEP